MKNESTENPYENSKWKNLLAKNGLVNKSSINHIQKWKHLLEADENFMGGKKLRVTGKDLRSLDKGIFKLKILLTRLDLSPDYQSCLNYRLGKLAIISNVLN